MQQHTIFWVQCPGALGRGQRSNIELLRVSEYSDTRGSEYKIEYEYSSLPKSLESRSFFFFFFFTLFFLKQEVFTKWSIEIFHYDYGSN